jgi:hypothetical protein
MPAESLTTWEALRSAISDQSGLYDLIFVNGKPYEGQFELDGYKGCGWIGGRTISVLFLTPIEVSSEVILVNLRYLRLRHCTLKVGPSNWKNRQEWVVIDLPEDQ